MALSSRERAALRAQANHLEATVSVGAAGISAAVVQSLEDAFRSRELVKVHVGRNASVVARQAAAELAGAAHAEVVQVIGHTTTLFRENPELRAARQRARRAPPGISDPRSYRPVASAPAALPFRAGR
ncbi:MAG TPA: YhbY family RNA-binding protein [Gemmatimonadaceae bacterium]|nr:YhbY family RNA-binding protein [Gemmatimonadaceae bacterium]